MKSLLSKTLSQFVICTVSIFVLATPLFYLLTKHFYAEDMIDIIEAIGQGKDIPPLDLEQDIMAGVMLQFILIFLVISISMFITMRFITRRLWHPFDDTLEKTEQFNLAHSDIPSFTKTDVKEFARLNHSLNRLMEKDKETFRIQKEFTENASHELQTPLAIVRSKLDLLLQEEPDERTMRIIADLYELNTRMEHLNRSLLLLAKIENAQYTKMESVDPHTSDGEIVLSLHEDHLTVSNPSDDGQSLPVSELFRRFRPDDAKTVGNGLGLSIVKAICDFHEWTITYKFEENRHCFIVQFGK